MKHKFITIGEIMLRLTPPDYEKIRTATSFEARYGGSEANVALSLANLGVDASFFTVVPGNSLGKSAVRMMRSNDVNCDSVIYSTEEETPTHRLGTYYLETGYGIRPSKVVYDRKHSSINNIEISDVPQTLFYNTRLFHTSGITLGLGGKAQDFAIHCIKEFKKQGTLISFDVNYRANLWTGAEARKCIETILPYVDIFFCSEDTARLTFGKTGTINEIQKSFCEEYPISVVASTERTVITPKKHNFTSIIYSAKNDTYYRENPYNNIDVVDRIGSGDAYVSGALYGYLKHGDCQKALEYGNAMAAIKHSVIGDMVFTDLEEIDSIIKQHKNTSGYQSEMNR